MFLALGEPSIVRSARQDLEDTWRTDDRLLDKFFPLGSEPSPQYLKARKLLFNEHPRYKRWKGISVDPRPFSRIFTPLTNLLNEIASHHGASRRERLFINYRSRRDKPGTYRPSIVLCGVGEEFANVSHTRPKATWSSCISVLEVVPDFINFTDYQNLLVTHMRKVFLSQENRRFAFGLFMTENHFTVYMFDHSGVVSSDRCYYHEQPERFCAVISGLCCNKELLGFDSTISTQGGLTTIRIYHMDEGEPEREVRYIVKHGLYYSRNLHGRGTTCWLAYREGEPQTKLVVKDAWMSHPEVPGREPEEYLLRLAQKRGVIDGLAQIQDFTDVRRSKDPSDLDTILRNRKIDDPSPEDLGLERKHTRIVVSPPGKPLDNFSSRKELLYAFYDAVRGHRRLHDVGGILHRDISVRNVLINPYGAEGNRGFLIDLDHSVRTDDTSPYARLTSIGTHAYMSRNSLEGKCPRTHLDDLESFYYVLCWVMGSFEGPGIMKTELPDELTCWSREFALLDKSEMMNREFHIPFSPWFGNSLRQLAIDLHMYFSYRQSAKSVPDAAKDYDEYLDIIRRAIASLEKEEMEAEAMISPAIGHTSNKE